MHDQRAASRRERPFGARSLPRGSRARGARTAGARPPSSRGCDRRAGAACGALGDEHDRDPAATPFIPDLDRGVRARRSDRRGARGYSTDLHHSPCRRGQHLDAGSMCPLRGRARGRRGIRGALHPRPCGARIIALHPRTGARAARLRRAPPAHRRSRSAESSSSRRTTPSQRRGRASGGAGRR